MGILILIWLGITSSSTPGTRRVRARPGRLASRVVTTVFLLVLATTLAACPNRVVRDAAVYHAELDQYDRWATRQAALLRDFVTTHCACDGSGFAEPRCKEAADWLLTVEARHGWHREMALFNAGLVDERPEASPPAIAESICPLPASEEDAR